MKCITSPSEMIHIPHHKLEEKVLHLVKVQKIIYESLAPNGQNGTIFYKVQL